MSRLFPPILGTQIPAFYQRDNDDLIIEVPFENNRAVSKKDIAGFIVRLKTITNDWVAISSNELEETVEETYANQIARFRVKKAEYQDGDFWKVNVGQSYKLQIAYIQKETLEIGYYSAISTVKFTCYPELSLVVSDSSYNFVGMYQQPKNGGDMTEKVLKYRFNLYKAKENDEETPSDNYFYTTGWLAHSVSDNEDAYSSYDYFTYLNEYTAPIWVEYQIETNGGIFVSTEKARVEGINPDEKEGLEINLTENFDNGYVKVNIEGKSEEDGFYYYLMRKDNSNDYYNRIHLFQKNETEFLDLTVEQGNTYEYCIYELQVVDNKIQYLKSINAVTVDFIDFEDAFLYDGKRQLKIRFNPNLSQFKKTKLISKLDTIGGAYPIFMENGNARYTEMTFGGLITYNMDEQNLFNNIYDFTETYRESTENKKENIQMSSGRIYYLERKFREDVIDWLQDGSVKLFRSPTEGNMLVRITNVNLTPNAQLSRKIYSFTANLVECDDCNYDTLLTYNIYNIVKEESEQEVPIDKPPKAVQNSETIKW